MRNVRNNPVMMMAGLLAASSMSVGSPLAPLEIKVSPHNRLASVEDEIIEETAKERGYARGRVGGNQRQRRKDRRRAHAAGAKHAFR